MEILYLDDVLVAVNKPAGLLVHRSALDSRATEFALQRVRDQLGRRVFPVHRLDRPVSGVLLFALDADTARILTGRFTAGEVEKTYLALVRGYTPDAGEIDHPLVEQLDAIADRLADRGKPAQSARTEFLTVARAELPFAVGRYPSARYSLVEVRPRTGRKHQIRRHLKHIFHPIIGDTTHGDGRHNQFFRDRFQLDRLLLAATALQLRHPASGIPLRIEAPLAADFGDIMQAIPWSIGCGSHPVVTGDRVESGLLNEGISLQP